jgi:hypothetical protein
VLYCGVAQHVFDLGQTLLPFAVFAEKVGRFTMTDEELKDFKVSNTVRQTMLENNINIL